MLFMFTMPFTTKATSLSSAILRPKQVSVKYRFSPFWKMNFADYTAYLPLLAKTAV